MAKKKSTKSKAAERDAASLRLTLQTVRLLDCKSEQTMAANRPLSNMSVRVTSETGEPRELNEAVLLCYRVASETQLRSDPTENEPGSNLLAVCRYEIQFLMACQPTTEENQLIEQMAVNICWPYVRSFISTIIKEMAQIPIVLPLLRVDPQKGIEFLPVINASSAQQVTNPAPN